PFSSTPPSPPSIYSLSLHDALPIFFHSLPENGIQVNGGIALRVARVLLPLLHQLVAQGDQRVLVVRPVFDRALGDRLRFFLGVVDRKSTRLNSSHRTISYAVFCLKK